MRTPKQKTVTIAGVEGTGQTLTAAKDAAMQTITQTIANVAYGILFIPFRNFVAIAWPGYQGDWNSRIIDVSKITSADVSAIGLLQSSCYARYTIEKLHHSLRIMLAQHAWSLEEKDDSAFADEIFSTPTNLDLSQARREFLAYTEFQRRYDRARKAGFSDNDCYDYGHGRAKPEIHAALDGNRPAKAA